MARKRQKQPLEIRMTMRVKFGTGPEETVTVMNNRRLRVIGSVFQHRDRAINFLVVNLLRAGTKRPAVLGRLAPAALGMMRSFTLRARNLRD